MYIIKSYYIISYYIISYYIYCSCKYDENPSLNFTYGVETLILYQRLKIPNLSHYKMMVLNLQGITENDNMILLQNEDGFLSWGYLKGKFHHYKMKIGFYMFLSSSYLKGTATSLATKWD